MQPSLDESKERFTYGRPDAQLIRNFCLEKFGWNFEKVDQILDPVLKVACPLDRALHDLASHRIRFY